MNIQLFEQVLSVLDPDMRVNREPKTPATSEHLNHGEAGKIRTESDHRLVNDDQGSTPANEKQVYWYLVAGPQQQDIFFKHGS